MTALLKSLNLHDVLGETFRSLKQFGFRRTVAVARSRLGDYAFDMQYGTDTVEPIALSELDIPHASVQLGRRYQPTGVKAFKSIMNALELPRGGVFVDFGSGKGRTLMLAALYPFARVVGVEFSEELCAIAGVNMEKFNAKEPTVAPIEIVQNDATLYPFRDDETVLYFFHPFGDEIFLRVLNNINASLERKPRRAWLLYNLADENARAQIEGHSSFALNSAQMVGGYDCMVFTNTSNRK